MMRNTRWIVQAGGVMFAVCCICAGANAAEKLNCLPTTKVVKVGDG